MPVRLVTLGDGERIQRRAITELRAIVQRLHEPKSKIDPATLAGVAPHLLTVADAFAITGRGVIVAPFLDASEARPERFNVELRRPDGARVVVEAFAQVPFISPRPAVVQAHLALLGIEKAEAPVGTQVWTVDDE